MMWAALWSYRHAFSFHPLCVPVWRRRPWLFVEGTRLASCDWTTGHPGSQAGAASPDSKPAKSIKREKPPFKWPWMLAEKRFLFLVIVLYTLFFFQFFFWCGPFSKSILNLLQYCFLSMIFGPLAMRPAGSHLLNQGSNPQIGSWNLNHWSPREVPVHVIKSSLLEIYRFFHLWVLSLKRPPGHDCLQQNFCVWMTLVMCFGDTLKKKYTSFPLGEFILRK